MLDSANERYPGLSDWYAAMSESANPNYEGILKSYSTVAHENHVTTFKSRCSDLHGQTHEGVLAVCLEVFIGEYNDESADALEALEKWIKLHDKEL